MYYVFLKYFAYYYFRLLFTGYTIKLAIYELASMYDNPIHYNKRNLRFDLLHNNKSTRHCLQFLLVSPPTHSLMTLSLQMLFPLSMCLAGSFIRTFGSIIKFLSTNSSFISHLVLNEIDLAQDIDSSPGLLSIK